MPGPTFDAVGLLAGPWPSPCLVLACRELVTIDLAARYANRQKHEGAQPGSQPNRPKHVHASTKLALGFREWEAV